MKIVVANELFGHKGGIERYLFETSLILKSDGFQLFGLFLKETENREDFTDLFEECIFYKPGSTDSGMLKRLKDKGVTHVLIHKINDNNLLSQLNKHFTTISFIHDHDYYCYRRHKYLPVSRKNCSLPMNIIYCSACSCLLEKDPNSFAGVNILNPLKKSKLLRQLKKCNYSIVLSDFMRGNLLKNGFDADKIKKINPFKTLLESTEFPKTGDGVNLLFAGQIIRGKGVDLLIRSVALLKNNFHLNIVGKGNDEEYIRDLIIELNLNSKVTMCGFSPNITKEYQNCDIVIFPSRWQEPFGLVGIEAFSNKKPVIGFDVGGVAEWLKDGINGFLVKEGNLQSMAEKIDMLIDDTETAQLFGENGYKMVKEEYNTGIFLSKLKELLRPN